MAPTQQLTERLPDCTELHALCCQVHLPIAEFLEALRLHAESNCAECARIERADQLLELEADARCTCHQSDADLFDATGCEYHDANSPWNVRLRAVTAVQLYEQNVKEIA